VSATSTIKVDIVSAEKTLFEGETHLLVATAFNGELGIKPRHAPMLAMLIPGQVRLFNQEGTEEQVFYISGGIIEVQPFKVTVLSDLAERASDLDESRLIEAQEEARKILESKTSEIEYATVQTRLLQASAQLAALRKWKNIRK
tara:strand:- start:5898 stop:6329 length:432 start_codon:yes stop_codon:yes gene_type:complete